MWQVVETVLGILGPLSPMTLILIAAPVLIVFLNVFKWGIWLIISLIMAFVQITYGAYQGGCIFLDLVVLSFIKSILWLNKLLHSFSYPSSSAHDDARRLLWKAHTYREWSALAAEVDRTGGHLEWNESKEDFPGLEKLSACVEVLRTARLSNDFRSLLYHLPSYVKRNHLGMDDIALFSGCYTSTKPVISEYMEEIRSCTAYVRELGDDILPIGEKIGFFGKMSRNLGQSALCLSGGGSLSMYHMGVIRALIESGNYCKVCISLIFPIDSCSCSSSAYCSAVYFCNVFCCNFVFKPCMHVNVFYSDPCRFGDFRRVDMRGHVRVQDGGGAARRRLGQLDINGLQKKWCNEKTEC
jgi:hypothetical protein